TRIFTASASSSRRAPRAFFACPNVGGQNKLVAHHSRAGRGIGPTDAPRKGDRLMKPILTSLLILSLAATTTTRAKTQPQPQPQTQPQQDQLAVEATNKKIQRSLAEFQRDSAVIYLRLTAELDKAQRNAEVQ